MAEAKSVASEVESWEVVQNGDRLVDIETGAVIGYVDGAAPAPQATRSFDAPGHMRKIRTRQGMQDYLDVKWRVAWLRAEHPEAQIITEQVEASETHARFKATISIPPKNISLNGGMATGHGSETQQDFPDFYEKAETKAIGRACAALGYGTDAAIDFDDPVVDPPAQAQGGYAPPVAPSTAPPRNIPLSDESGVPLHPSAVMPAPRPQQGGASRLPATRRQQGSPAARESEMLDYAVPGRAQGKPNGGALKPDTQEQDEHLRALKPDAPINPPLATQPSNAQQHKQLEALQESGLDMKAIAMSKWGVNAAFEELTREQAKELIIAGRDLARGAAS